MWVAGRTSNDDRNTMTTKMIEFRFHNEYIDSTVAVQEDGSVIERYGAGGVVVTRPQKFASIGAWLSDMERDTSLCSRDPRDDYDYDEDAEEENLLLWFIPTVYSCGGRKAANTPDGDVVEEGLVWQTSADWALHVIASAPASIRRSRRLAAKPAVNYVEEDAEAVTEPKPTVATIRRSTRLAEKASLVVRETTAPVSTLSNEEKRMVAHIKGFLERIETAKGKEIKAAISAELFYFIAIFGKEFCAKHKRFGDTVIAKAYEFKKNESNSMGLMKAADTMLLTLGA